MENKGKFIIEFGSANTVYYTLIESLSRLSRERDINLVLLGDVVYQALKIALNESPAYQSQYMNHYTDDRPLQLMEWEVMCSRQVSNYGGYVYTSPRENIGFMTREDVNKTMKIAYPLTPSDCFKKKELVWLEPNKM